MTQLSWCWLGRVDWDDGVARQREALAAVQAGEPGRLLLLEHDPTITLGRRADTRELRVGEAELANRGITLRQAERGGLATYHGPGQIVGYLVVKVRSVATGLPELVDRIEGALIAIGREMGVHGRRDTRGRGMWIGPAKAGFIGLAVSRGVTWHGFSLNVEPDLATFNLIRPCGLDTPVTSIVAAGGSPPPLPAAASIVGQHMAAALGARPIRERIEPRTTTATVCR